MKIKVFVHTGYYGADYEDEIEMSDDATENDCEDVAREYMENYIEYGWEKVESDA